MNKIQTNKNGLYLTIANLNKTVKLRNDRRVFSVQTALLLQLEYRPLCAR